MNSTGSVFKETLSFPSSEHEGFFFWGQGWQLAKHVKVEGLKQPGERKV